MVYSKYVTLDKEKFSAAQGAERIQTIILRWTELVEENMKGWIEKKKKTAICKW